MNGRVSFFCKWARRCTLLALVASARGATPVIVEYGGGALGWSAQTQSYCHVEWASSLHGPWFNSWRQYVQQPVTNRMMSVEVPAFYRVCLDPVMPLWANIGNKHNNADATGFGTVRYDYRLARHEVDNAQYTAFLNTVDPDGDNDRNLYNALMGTDPRGGILFDAAQPNGAKYAARTNSFMQNKPVNYVSYWDACRFCNWMHNGQGVGSTEQGAYDLNAVNPTNQTVVRGPGARFFLPTEDEWYKAAYYNSAAAVYWDYTTHSDAPPTRATADAQGNINNLADGLANYNLGADWNGQDGNVTTVGSGGASSQSGYGLYDMGGNVDEWVDSSSNAALRVLRGGNWTSAVTALRADMRVYAHPTNEFHTTGFRLAAISATINSLSIYPSGSITHSASNTLQFMASGGAGVYNWSLSNTNLGRLYPTNEIIATYEPKLTNGTQIVTVRDNQASATCNITQTTTNSSGGGDYPPLPAP